jgi:phosphatidylcholine synthase
MLPWIAHLYTGLGAVVALMATLAVVAGDYRAAFLWLGLQMFIDATDGVLARALRVKERLPHFDGGKLDDLIDYLTYVFIPVLLVLHARLLPASTAVWIGGAVLLASGYGFSQSAAKVKASDYFFTGFPSYWNLVVAYLYLLPLSPVISAAVLLLFTALVFVPLRYVYPSRTKTLRGVTNVGGAVWAATLAWLVWELPARHLTLTLFTLLYPVYYFVLSFWLDRRSRSAMPAR